MSMFQKRHCVAIAEVLRVRFEALEGRDKRGIFAWVAMKDSFTCLFIEDSHKFKVNEFNRACGLARDVKLQEVQECDSDFPAILKDQAI